MLRACWLAGAVAILSGAPATAEDRGILRKPLLGQVPPEIAADADDWLAGPAVCLEKLRGRVVWLQFNF